MPVPSADYILAMLNPYAGFDPTKSAQVGIEAGRLGLQRQQQAEQKRQLDAENQRANSYLDLQRQQWQTGQTNQLRDKRIGAFTQFQAAVDSGDVEQAELAAQGLRLLGVGVEAFGGGTTGRQNAAPSTLGAMAATSPTAAIAQAQARTSTKTPARPMSAADQQTSAELDQLAKDATVGAYDPFAALAVATLRPGAQRSAGLPAPAPQQPAPEGEAEVSIRPGAARTPFIRGQEPTPEPESRQQAPTRGYRLNFDGQVITIDPESIAERQRQRVRGVLEPLVKSAATASERAAASAALEAAEKAVGIVSPQEAVKLGITSYENELNRNAALERAKVGGRRGGTVVMGGAFDKADMTRQAGVADDIDQLVKGFEANDEVKHARSSVANADRVIGMVKSGNTVAEWAAQQGVLKSFVSGVASDQDLAGFLGSMGRTNQILKEFNAWFEGGAMPEDINRKVGELSVQTRAFYEKKLVATAERAANYFEGNPALTSRMSPEDVRAHKRNIFYRISGRRMPEPKGSAAPTKSGGAAAPAPAPAKPSGAATKPSGGKSTAQQRAEALLKRTGGQ